MLRACTIDIPRFAHEGLVVVSNWTEIELETDEARAALRDFHGRFFQVHPDDEAGLAELGLAFDKDAEVPRRAKLVETGEKRAPAAKPEKRGPGRPKKSDAIPPPAK